jgi:hypothetical protein
MVARSFVVLWFSLAGCVGSVLAQQGTAPAPSPQPFALKTPAFSNGAYIPGKYGCDIPQAQGTP